MEKKRIPIPQSAGENVSGFFEIKDNNVAPFLRAGDYVLIQDKREAKDYRAGEFCVILFEGEPSVRSVWWKDDCLMLWDFADRADIYAPDALDQAHLIGTIVGIYRPMKYELYSSPDYWKKGQG